MFFGQFSIRFPVKTLSNTFGTQYKRKAKRFAGPHKNSQVFPALYRITRLLNLPTDIPKRLLLSETFREQTAILRKEARAKMDIIGGPAKEMPAIDMLPIKVGYIRLQLGHKTIEYRSKVEMHQGFLSAVVGRRGEGKSTLLKLIGGEILPPLEAGQTIPIVEQTRFQIATGEAASKNSN